MDITTLPWGMKNGRITEYKINGEIWTRKQKGNSKRNYFIKWLTDKQVGYIFTFEDFYKKHPKHKTDVQCRNRMDKVMSKLIGDKKLVQMSNDKFKINKKIQAGEID